MFSRAEWTGYILEFQRASSSSDKIIAVYELLIMTANKKKELKQAQKQENRARGIVVLPREKKKTYFILQEYYYWCKNHLMQIHLAEEKKIGEVNISHRSDCLWKDANFRHDNPEIYIESVRSWCSQTNDLYSTQIISPLVETYFLNIPDYHSNPHASIS